MESNKRQEFDIKSLVVTRVLLVKLIVLFWKYITWLYFFWLA